MKDKLIEIFKSIQIYHQKEEELKKIDSEKKDFIHNSEYYQKINELTKLFNKNGIFLTFSNESFDEILKNIEQEVKNKIDLINQRHYPEEEIMGAYNELTSEEKKEFESYEVFKNAVLEDLKKQQDKEKNEILELVEEFKKTKVSYDNMNKGLQELDDKRKIILNDRWNLLETKLKNIDSELLEKGFEYQNGFPLIKEDTKVVQSIPKLDADNISLDDLVMVHATQYFPQDGVIKSRRDAIGANRNTIHTALNGRVSSHNFGNWDDCGIIIIDPLKEHINQVECIYSVDTFAYGSMKLSDEALILIDNSKYNEIYEQNKEYLNNNKDRIILYSGDSTVVVEKLLSILGYAPQKIGQWGWEDKHNAEMLNKFAQDNYHDKLNTAHDNTVYSIVEKGRGRDDTLASFGIVDYGNDMVITLDVLYSLRMNNKNMSTEQFIQEVGVFVKDNEIHLLGVKDHIDLLKSQNISKFQIEKIDLLVKKYELMLQKQNEEEIEKQR